jgi:serine/threonine protein kinase
VKVINKT